MREVPTNGDQRSFLVRTLRLEVDSHEYLCYYVLLKGMRKMQRMKNREKETPSTVTQLASAMAALGMYTGENTEAEHAAEAKRLGSADYFRLFMANALLGMVETEVML